MATEDELLAVKKKYKDELFALPNVHAVGIGLKERGGVLTTELAIVCLVEKKVELAQLDPNAVIPPSLDGIPTDVQETSRPRLQTSNNFPLLQQFRPLVGGIQIQLNGFNGTLGFVGVLPDGTMVAVSNQHVLEKVGDTVYQPDAQKHNDIGTTTKVKLSPQVDGGYLIPNTTLAPVILRWNGAGQYTSVAIDGAMVVRPADLPYPVWKTGRTTGSCSGNVTIIDLSGTREDEFPYEDQMTIKPTDSAAFSLPGDSGSAVVSNTVEVPNRIVGLLWGGSIDASVSYASRIGDVNEELGIEVATGDGEQLQEPVVIPSFAELLARLNSDQGKRIASFLMEHVAAISDLINSDRRVGVIWSRHRFHEMCNKIIENVATKSTPLPAEMVGEPTQPALEELVAALIERGNPSLGSAIEAVRNDIVWVIDRPYTDVAGES